jgi:hypothetical protein
MPTPTRVLIRKCPKLPAVRLADELNKKPPDGASLDELLEQIKAELTELGPIIDLEVVREPQGREPSCVDHRLLGPRRLGALTCLSNIAEASTKA